MKILVMGKKKHLHYIGRFKIPKGPCKVVSILGVMGCIVLIPYLSTIILSKTEIDFAKHIAVLHKIDSPSYVDALKIAKRHIMMTITCITKMNCEYMSVGVLMRYLKGKNN